VIAGFAERVGGAPVIPLLKKPFVVDNVATALTLAPAAGGLDAGPACRFGDGER